MKDSNSSEVDLEEWRVDGRINEQMEERWRVGIARWEGEEERLTEGKEETMEGGKTTLMWIGGDTLTKRSRWS